MHCRDRQPKRISPFLGCASPEAIQLSFGDRLPGTLRTPHVSVISFPKAPADQASGLLVRVDIQGLLQPSSVSSSAGSPKPEPRRAPSDQLLRIFQRKVERFSVRHLWCVRHSRSVSASQFPIAQVATIFRSVLTSSFGQAPQSLGSGPSIPIKRVVHAQARAASIAPLFVRFDHVRARPAGFRCALSSSTAIDDQQLAYFGHYRTFFRLS